jgi:hypothetical protein
MEKFISLQKGGVALEKSKPRTKRKHSNKIDKNIKAKLRCKEEA